MTLKTTLLACAGLTMLAACSAPNEFNTYEDDSHRGPYMTAPYNWFNNYDTDFYNDPDVMGGSQNASMSQPTAQPAVRSAPAQGRMPTDLTTPMPEDM